MIAVVSDPIAWISIANTFFLLAYAVHDILWLRILSVLGSAVLIRYYLLLQPAQPVAVFWTLLFIALNTGWIVSLLVERRPVKLSSREERLREIAFASLTHREAQRLFAKGRWDNVDQGSSLVEHDNATGQFSVILSGSADVTFHGKTVGRLNEGEFIGGIDRRAVLVDLDVIVRARATVMCWRREVLDEFASKRPDVALSLERSISLELRNVLDGALSKLAGTAPAQRNAD